MIRDPRSSPTDSSTYPRYPSPYIRRSSPPGSPAANRPTPNNCCFDHRKPPPTESLFCCCYTCSGDNNKTSTSILTTLGVCCLVLAYTILGAFVFMTLEGGGMTTETAVAASTKTDQENNDIHVDKIVDLRTETVDRLWSITENLNILYRENWTRLAAEEVLVFQKAIFKVLRRSSSSGHFSTTYYQTHQHKWSFSSSFLYSLTLITTIGEFCVRYY